jgi:hypothetical protein
VSDRWWGILIAGAGLAMIWAARGSAEVDYELSQALRERVPRKRWWIYNGMHAPRPEIGTAIRRGMGVVVVLAGIALVVSPDLFGLM